MKKMFLSTFIVLLLTGVAWPPVGMAQNITETWTAEPPTTGNPAIAYQWGWYLTTAPADTVKIPGEVVSPEPTWPEVGLTYPLLYEIRVVVRARDELNRWGPWTASEPYMPDLGPPGGCALVRRK